jgi:hypothetical protein
MNLQTVQPLNLPFFFSQHNLFEVLSMLLHVAIQSPTLQKKKN